MDVMTASETIKIMKALKPKLGEKAAVELIGYIESAHTDRLASKADLQELRAATKADIQELRAATKADIQELRADTKADIQELRANTKADIQELRANTKADIQELRADTKAEMLALENRLTWKILGGVGLMMALATGLVRFLAP